MNVRRCRCFLSVQVSVCVHVRVKCNAMQLHGVVICCAINCQVYVCMYVYIIIYIYERPHENESMRRACPGMCAHLFASLCVFGGDACISGVYVYAHAYIMYIRIHIVKSIYMCI